MRTLCFRLLVAKVDTLSCRVHFYPAASQPTISSQQPCPEQSVSRPVVQPVNRPASQQPSTINEKPATSNKQPTATLSSQPPTGGQMQFHNDGCLPLSLLCRVPLLVAVLPLLCTACLAMTLSYLSTRPSWFCTLPPTTNALIFLYLQTCQCCVLPTALFVALAHPALLPLQVQLDLK